MRVGIRMRIVGFAVSFPSFFSLHPIHPFSGLHTSVELDGALGQLDMNDGLVVSAC
jgi:hypothetical protein